MHIQKKICPTCAMDVRMDYLPGTYILKCPSCDRMETISGTIISFGRNCWPLATSGSDEGDVSGVKVGDLESMQVKVLVDAIVATLPIADVMEYLTARFPEAAMADLCMAYARLLIWVRETNTPHELLPVTKVYQAGDEQFEEHIFRIWGEKPRVVPGAATMSSKKDGLAD